MNHPNITDEIAIIIHLAPLREFDGILYASGFMLALRDARKFTNRNQDTGEKSQSGLGDHGSWLGAIGYFALLDQIGSCFEPKQKNKVVGNSIVKTLQYFSSTTQLDTEAIYALRCAFAHDFSLINIHSKKTLTHIFTVYAGKDPDIVTLPTNPWDGDLNNIQDDNITLINLEAFGDLVEGIYKKLLLLSENNELEIILKGGAQELFKKYSIHMPSKIIKN